MKGTVLPFKRNDGVLSLWKWRPRQQKAGLKCTQLSSYSKSVIVLIFKKCFILNNWKIISSQGNGT